jgi:hypothetical protein
VVAAGCLEIATKRRDYGSVAKLAGAQKEGYVQSIIGATEKRRERGAVCRGIGASESAG